MARPKFDHKKIENNWKDKWFDNNIFAAEDFSKKEKKYILAELPYPSGEFLHVGHMLRYTVPEIYSRYLRMKGYNVLFPMGWDSFGLPAETYAQKAGITPQEAIATATKNFKRSMKDMGYAIDWNREINTSDPEFYKWTQWTFKKLWEKGLAIQQEMPVWWCEELGVLADEEVLPDPDGDGKISERGGHKVEKKMFKQWVLDIPAYADRLIADLDKVDYQESVKAAQRAWIGRKEGALVDFEIVGVKVPVFTTRPDTIFGVTFLAVSPEHSAVQELIKKAKNSSEVEEYVKRAASLSDLEKQTKEKTGVLLEGVFATHPFEEVTREIPVFVADYILLDYGTGAIMGVPAHDERDSEFANKYGLEIVEVIDEDDKVLNSGDYDGQSAVEFAETVVRRLEKEKKGTPSKQYKIRPQVFSRQRYWGEPIPLIYKENGEIEAVPDENLPVELPPMKDFLTSDDGVAPLAKDEAWLNTIDSEGKPAKRETDTMPTWAGSNWYYLRYIDPHNSEGPADPKLAEYWLPVDTYFGTAAHTTAHLLYSRFWFKFLYDIGAVPMDEPYMYRMSGGMLLGEDNQVMSKSRGNVVSPQEVLENYGADAIRVFLSFIGPYEGTYPWNPQGLIACARLVKDIYELGGRVGDIQADEETEIALHTLVQKSTRMFEDLKLNTAVSEIMIFVNHLRTLDKIPLETWKTFVRVAAPFAPFTAEELWHEANNLDGWKNENSVHLQDWPKFDENILEQTTITLPVQINGKLRDTIEIERGLSEDEVRDLVLALPNIQERLAGKAVSKFVYVPEKIANIVL